MDYTEDKTDENEVYPRCNAASASKKSFPILVEIVKHDFELQGGRYFKTGTTEATANVSIYLGGLFLFTRLSVFRLWCFSLLQIFDTCMQTQVKSSILQK